ncbi:uncharacterized protein JCM15063_006271 [Sporobolomyces koalae]|uniref:uncharacterized protein n=1 Tax=Sporobolomyces koalae TaxID=500713 RepID=UPI00317FFA49
MKRRAPRNYSFSSSSAAPSASKRTKTPSTAPMSAPPSHWRGGARNRGRSRAANSSNGSSSRPPPPPAPSAPGPIHSQEYILKTLYQELTGNPRAVVGPKYLENPKGIIANYLKALGEDVHYSSAKKNVDGTNLFRCTIVADPDPPPPQRSYGAPSMPGIIEPIVGTGDSPVSAKEAEKLAALEACVRLSARNLFTNSNLPLRMKGQQTPLHSASQQPSMASSSAYNAPAPSGGFSNAFTAASSSSYGQSSTQLTVTPAAYKQQRQQQQAQAQAQGDGNDGKHVTLVTGQKIDLAEARLFMDFYCSKFNFPRPDLNYTSQPTRQRGVSTWRATLSVQGSRIGMGVAKRKDQATKIAYLDTASYLTEMDPALWSDWEAKKQSKQVEKGVVQASVEFFVRDDEIEEQVAEAVGEAADSELVQRGKDMRKREDERARKERERYLQKRRGLDSLDSHDQASTSQQPEMSELERERFEAGRKVVEAKRQEYLSKKSQEMRTKLSAYQTDDQVAKLRAQRASLPVTSHASSVLSKIAVSPVVVVLAATGSGKTTQIPQLILDDAIADGKGAECNIVCTQPRRIAAISVAERVAKERGQVLGDQVGYQVRFEQKLPRKDGSIMFCTTGLFLRRLQSDLDKTAAGEGSKEGDSFLDGVTHVAVDEVHERDVDTDLLLFVLRRLLHERRKIGKKEIKVVLMSATIDPKLFTEYFKDPDTGMLAPTVSVPGRSFPVEKYWLDDIVETLQGERLPQNRGGWVFNEKAVIPYLQRELVPSIPIDHRTGKPVGEIDDLEMPYPLLALIIAYVMSKSDEGHVLVFLPGWDEIQSVRNILQDRQRYPLLDLNFNDTSRYELHVLHSTIPIADQQAVFEPPSDPRIRRIVLSTNIAETSVTIPDVVYVVDSAKCKEKRYDPERRLSQLVSAWTGTSNVLQRAGRAGRHREGEYYGIVSKARFASMDIHQTVEMLRTDLASTAMHVTGLQLPGLSVFDVLSSTIQPPEPQRVRAALETLLHVGAIDANEHLTSLGRVLLQLPVEAAIGKLCLLGSFFRCLEQTLTLAAILTNRDPFLSPPLMKEQADRIKNSWAPAEFRSDPLAILQAYNAWWELQGRGDYSAANSFARDNFLSKPTLLLIQKIKEHLLSSLDRAGVLQISGGGAQTPQPFFRGRRSQATIPAHLNQNGHSLPLLSALIATAVAPNFAIRVSEKSLRTIQDKSCAIHPSSVNSRKNEKAADVPITSSRQLYAFGEKSKTGAMGGKGEGQTFLRATTKLDPLGYMLFGAYDLQPVREGLVCDGWLPIVAGHGAVSVLDDVERLKGLLDLSLLRVFEGLNVAISKGQSRSGPQGNGRNRHQPPRGRQFDKDDEDEDEGDEDVVDKGETELSKQEVKDLDQLTGNVVTLLNTYALSLGPSSSRTSSRPATPSLSTVPQPLHPLSSSAPGSRFGSQNHTPYSSRPPSVSGFNQSDSGWGSSNGGAAGGRGGRGNWRS